MLNFLIALGCVSAIIFILYEFALRILVKTGLATEEEKRLASFLPDL